VYIYTRTKNLCTLHLLLDTCASPRYTYTLSDTRVPTGYVYTLSDMYFPVCFYCQTHVYKSKFTKAFVPASFTIRHMRIYRIYAYTIKRMFFCIDFFTFRYMCMNIHIPKHQCQLLQWKFWSLDYTLPVCE